MVFDTALKIKDDLVKMRRDLHQIPEIGFDVYKTCEYIEKILDVLKLNIIELQKLELWV